MKDSKTSYGIREFGNSTPTLRKDLQIHFESFQGEPCCIIKDPVSSQFFRTSARIYHFIKKLDGKTPLSAALGSMAEDSSFSAINEDEALQILSWLLENQLVETAQATRAERLSQKELDRSLAQFSSKANPLSIKIPLGNPDSLLNEMRPIINGIFSFPGFLVWFFTGVYALYQFSSHTLSEAILPRAFLPNNWVYIALCWLVLKIVHEFGHGFACKRFGGTVPEMGIMLILFAPMAYVDTSTIWQLGSKWKRILVGVAGMYNELFFAALGTFVWLNTSPGILNTLGYNFMITGSVVTLFFNANPLMRFDGYYILSDWIEIPNLYSQGIQRVTRLAKYFLIGIQGLEPFPDKKDFTGWFVLFYGFGVIIWKFLIITSLTIAASALFKGLGIILALLGAIAWVGQPALSFVRYLRKGNRNEQPRFYQYSIRITLFLVVLGLIGCLPYQGTLKAPAIVFPLRANILRVECPGFMKTQVVSDQQFVPENKVLLSLTNEEEELKYANLEREYEKNKIQAHSYLSEEKLADYQAQQEKLISLEEQKQDQKQYLETLTIKSPKSGIITPEQPEPFQPDAFLQGGTAIFALRSEEYQEVTLMIKQKDVDAFALHNNKPVNLKFFGQPSIYKGILTRIIPRATFDPPHPALTANNGGPLPIVPTKKKGAEESYELTEPYFIGSVQMSKKLENLYEGQIGMVKFKSDDWQLLGTLVWRKLHNRLDRLFNLAQKKH